MNNTEREELLQRFDTAIADAWVSFTPGFYPKLQRLLTHPKKIILRKIIIGLLKQKYRFVLKTKTFFGATMYLDNGDQALWFNGTSLADAEIRLTKYLIKNIDTNQHEVFMDIGANYGFYTVLASTISGSRVEVHAFEPSRKLFSILRKNAAMLKKVHITNAAVYSAGGTVTFFDTGTAVSTTDKTFAGRSVSEGRKFNERVVPAVTLDEYVRSNSLTPSFLKIDVEGAEQEVLLGARETLHNCNPTVALEVWKEHNVNHMKAAAILLQHGYVPFIITQEGDLEQIPDLSRTDIAGGFDNLIFKKL